MHKNVKFVWESCGDCGHWVYLQSYTKNDKKIREGICSAYDIITTEEGWCKTHTAYNKENE